MYVETWLESDLKGPILVENLPGNLFSGDNNGNLIGVTVTDEGEPAALAGNVCGFFIRDDGTTVVVDGELDGNRAFVILPAACYVKVGQFSFVIKIGTITIGACTGRVYLTSTDEVIDPTGVVPSIEELLATIDNECFVISTGTISSFPKVIEDNRIDETCIVLDELIDEHVDIGYVTQQGKIILYGSLPANTTLSSKRLKIHRCAGITNDAVAVSLRLVEVTSENGNYLVADTSNLIPGVQYSWRLYSVANNTDTYVYGIGAVASYPNRSMRFQEVPRGLTDGTVYKVKVSPTLNSSDEHSSNTVTFVGGSGVPAAS